MFLGIFFPLEKIPKFTPLPYMGVLFFEALFPGRFPGCKSTCENPGLPYGVDGVRGISAFENRGLYPGFIFGDSFSGWKIPKNNRG